MCLMSTSARCREQRDHRFWSLSSGAQSAHHLGAGVLPPRLESSFNAHERGELRGERHPARRPTSGSPRLVKACTQRRHIAHADQFEHLPGEMNREPISGEMNCSSIVPTCWPLVQFPRHHR